MARSNELEQSELKFGGFADGGGLVWNYGWWWTDCEIRFQWAGVREIETGQKKKKSERW